MIAGHPAVEVVHWSRLGTAAAIVAESDATRSAVDLKGAAAPEHKEAPGPGPEGRGKPAGITGFGK